MSPGRTVAVSAAAAAALVLAACGGSGPEHAAAPAVTASDSTTLGATPAEGEHNEADVTFAQMMIPHHAEAIEMSDVVLAKDGVDERVVALAERVKGAQGPEIERMTAWLQAWGEDVPRVGGHDAGEMQHRGGGMGDAVEAIAEADGAEASRTYVRHMIEHHRGAIEMAERQVASGSNEEAVALAREIAGAQEAEIEEMEALLEEL